MPEEQYTKNNQTILIKNGVTQPVFNYEKCLFEKVYVETPLDTDGDGKRDLIAVYIRRPLETTFGLKVPAIYVANPYMVGCNEDSYELSNVDENLFAYPKTANPDSNQALSADTTPVSQPLPPERVPTGIAKTAPTKEIDLEVISPWYGYFNTRGYASVFCAGLGTRDSEGFNDTGSKEEIIAFTAVLEWLGGRRRAFTNKVDSIEIKASWCNGKAAMSGKSYLGTLAVGVACTGVPELKTIIPEAAISNWYDYFRQNGLPVPCVGWQGDEIHRLAQYCFSRRLDPEDYATVQKNYKQKLKQTSIQCDRESGNYNSFWAQRNYLNQANGIKASVLIVHGLNDWNVKLDHCANLWHALEKYNVPRKMLLHQGGHVYIHNHATIGFTPLLHRWLDYWLHGIENGVMDTGPEVRVQNNHDQYHWLTSNTWPVSSQTQKFCPKTEKILLGDNLALTGYNRQQDTLEDWLKALVETPEEAKPYRSFHPLFTPEEDTRISGIASVQLTASLDTPTGILSAMLVDYGQSLRLGLDLEIIEKDGFNLGPGAGTMDIVRFLADEKASPYRVITRGWLNVQNRSSNSAKEVIQPGHPYSFTLKMIPTDYILREGHTLGLILYGTDAQFTPRPFTVTTFTLEPNSITAEVPVCPL